MNVAPYFRLSLPDAKQILREVEEGTALWRKEGKALGMTPLELDQFEDAFEHEEREAARKIVCIVSEKPKAKSQDRIKAKK